MIPVPGQRYRNVCTSVFCRVRHVDEGSKHVQIVVEGMRESLSLDEFNAAWKFCFPLLMKGESHGTTQN